MVLLVPSAAATQVPADDSVQVTTHTHDEGVTAEFNHLGSSLIETVVVNIDMVSLLSWIGAPFG